MSRHAFKFKTHNSEHTGHLGDEVAEWFSTVLAMTTGSNEAEVVAALKGAARELLPTVIDPALSPRKPPKAGKA